MQDPAYWQSSGTASHISEKGDSSAAAGTGACPEDTASQYTQAEVDAAENMAAKAMQPTKKKSQQCGGCNDLFSADSILIGVWDWQGDQNTRCFECLQWGPPLKEDSIEPGMRIMHFYGKVYDADWPHKYNQKGYKAQQKAFKKEVQHAWKREGLKSGRTSQRLRGMAWSTAMNELRSSGANLTRAEARRALLQATGLFCVKLVSAHMRASAAQQREMEEAMRAAAADEYANRAADAEYVRAKVEGAFLEANTSQWLSKLVDGLDEYFICRRKACQFFCPNSLWMKRLFSDKFRCLACTAEYQPSFPQRSEFYLDESRNVATPIYVMTISTRVAE